MEPTTATSNVVVIRPGALGDTMLTLPALEALRRRFPGREIELVGNHDAGQLLAHWGVVDTVTSFEGPDVMRLYESEPRVSARWARASVVVAWLGDGTRIANAFRAQTGAHVIVAAPPVPARAGHASDQLLVGLGPIVGDGDAPPPPPGDHWLGHGSRVAALHPGSGAPRKNWPAERFAGLAGRLIGAGWCVRAIQGPADGEAVNAMLESLAPSLRSEIRVVIPNDIDDLAATLATAGVFVGNDSGVSHVAAALGVPTVAIFGATDPAVWAPRGARVSAIGAPDRWPSLDAAAAAVSNIAKADPVGDSAGVAGTRLDEDGARKESEQDQNRDSVNHLLTPSQGL